MHTFKTVESKVSRASIILDQLLHVTQLRNLNKLGVADKKFERLNQLKVEQPNDIEIGEEMRRGSLINSFLKSS